MTTALLQVATGDRERTAVIDPSGSYTYGRLDTDAWRVANALLSHRQTLAAARVAYLVTPGYQYAVVQEGIWRAGGIAVPLALSHPLPELEYVLRDTAADIVVCDARSRARLGSLSAEVGVRLLMVEDLLAGATAVARLWRAPDRFGVDRLHERNDGKTQGGGQHAREPGRAGWQSPRRLGVVGGGSVAARPPAAPHSRHPERFAIRARGKGDLRNPPELRRGPHLVASGVRRDHRVHRGTHGVSTADHRMGRGVRGRSVRLLNGSGGCARDDVGFRGAAGAGAATVARDLRPYAARTLRHDRDWHGPVESASGRPPAGLCRRPAAGC